MTANSSAALRGSRAFGLVAVIGRHRSGDVVSATLVDGHSSGVPRSAEAAPVGRRHALAPPRNRGCQIGSGWGRLSLSRFSVSSALG